jgi:lysophospholipase L1-like esterase
VVLLGDSISWGETSGEVEPDTPDFADWLRVELGDGVRVVNIACSGASSLDWTESRGDPKCGRQGEQLPNLYRARAIPALPADVVTVILGTNDAGGFLEEAPVPLATYLAAIHEIVRNLRRDGAKKVLLMTAPQNFSGRKPVHERLAAYRRGVLALCARSEDVECGPDLHELMRPEHFSESVHPNAGGHRAMAELVAPAVSLLLLE